MEVGLHEMDGLHELDSKVGIFEYLRISENVNFVKAPEVFRFKQNEFDFTLPHGKEESLRSLIKEFPHEEKAIRKFINLMEGVIREMANYPDGIKAILMYPILPLLYPNIVTASKHTVGSYLDKYFKDDLKMFDIEEE